MTGTRLVRTALAYACVCVCVRAMCLFPCVRRGWCGALIVPLPCRSAVHSCSTGVQQHMVYVTCVICLLSWAGCGAWSLQSAQLKKACEACFRYTAYTSPRGLSSPFTPQRQHSLVTQQVMTGGDCRLGCRLVGRCCGACPMLAGLLMRLRVRQSQFAARH